MERPDTQPPGWVESLPRSARAEDRFLHPRGDLVCGRATRICYKDGKIDKSDTERVFSGRAADRADDLRDRHGTGRLFAPERGVACDRERRICLEDGDPDRGLTRRYFGPRAARTIDEGRPRDDDARGVERRSKRNVRFIRGAETSAAPIGPRDVPGMDYLLARAAAPVTCRVVLAGSLLAGEGAAMFDFRQGYPLMVPPTR